MDFIGIDMLALMPCPLKVPFENKINQYLQEIKVNENIHLECSIEANVNNQYIYASSGIYENLINKDSVQELPDLIFSTGLNSLFHTEFTEKFINKGYFEEALTDAPFHFDDIGYRDPQKHYTMLAINPLLMVIDLEQQQNLPVPEVWADLIKPCYKDNIILRGHKGMYCETVLLNIFKEHGYEGIEALSHNVKDGLHPSQMAKLIASSRKEKAFIYVMPYFFARTLMNKQNIKLVWPEEGALANPVSLLIKKEAKPEVKRLANFIVGAEMGKVFANAGFPVVNQQVDNQLPNTKLKWIGWDFIRIDALEDRMRRINAYFNTIGGLSDACSQTT